MKNWKIKIASAILIPAAFLAVNGWEARRGSEDPVALVTDAADTGTEETAASASRPSAGSENPAGSNHPAGSENSAGSNLSAGLDLPAGTQASASEGTPSQTAVLQVYLCGSVAAPGVYAVPEGSRVADALAAAGGFADGADPAAVNLAAWVSDGQMIYFPAVSESVPHAASAGRTDPESPSADAASAALVPINSASEEELMTLPGIGAAKAAAIIAYREANGPFAELSDLCRVPGIKEALYSGLKDRIRLN